MQAVVFLMIVPNCLDLPLQVKHQEHVKRLVKILALIAILFQAMIPLGFMPGKAMAGTAIVICSGFGMKTVIVDDNGQPQKEMPGAPAQKSCEFALSASPADQPQVDILVVPSADYVSAAAIFASFAAFPAAYSLPDKTGPPSHLV